jgi:hydroxyacylglutathione hydrolase
MRTMLFERVKTPGIAHNAYVIGHDREAAVVDPRRDVDEYLEIARRDGAAIKYLIVTHRQEDFELGTADLARRLGAKVVTGRHELFGHGDVRLKTGEELRLGGLRIQALETPGHTPESMSYAVYAPEQPDRAWGVFTGDALFVGETGRTDLADPRRTAENAAILWESVHKQLAPLGDQTMILPAHGAGSVCGGDIADRDQSTIGLERTYNPVFLSGKEAFARQKLKDVMPRPPYFDHMERVNLKGGRPLRRAPIDVPQLPPRVFSAEMGQALVIDARDPEAWAAGHLPGSLNIWRAGLPMFSGWFTQPGARVLLIVPRPGDAGDAVLAFARIGFDDVEGVLAGGFESWRDAGLPVELGETIAPRALAKDLASYQVLDVRESSELEETGAIPGALNVYVGHLEERLGEVRSRLEDVPVAVVCSVGHRAGVAASVLRKHGLRRVANVLGGMTAWTALKLPTTGGPRS